MNFFSARLVCTFCDEPNPCLICLTLVAVELFIELLDLLTDESLPDWTNQGPIKIFPIYGGRFSDPLKRELDPAGNPEARDARSQDAY